MLVAEGTGYAVWLDPKEQSKMHCKLAGDVKYSTTSAAKCAKSKPWTNRPLHCPPCSQKRAAAVHWKVNMPAHWHSAHSSGVPFESNFAAELETTAEENSWMRLVRGERRKVALSAH